MTTSLRAKLLLLPLLSLALVANCYQGIFRDHRSLAGINGGREGFLRDDGSDGGLPEISFGDINYFPSPSSGQSNSLEALADNGFYKVEYSKDEARKSYFPLLMPKIHPVSEEAYICTPVKVKDNEFYITGTDGIK